VAHPARFEFEAFPWFHENGVPEVTNAGRLSQTGARGRFITLRTPGSVTAESVPNGVRFQLKDGQTDEPVHLEDGAVRLTRNGQALDLVVPADIDPHRPQGDIGQFVPDVAYPFGRLPDWLIRQRARHDNHPKVSICSSRSWHWCSVF